MDENYFHNYLAAGFLPFRLRIETMMMIKRRGYPVNHIAASRRSHKKKGLPIRQPLSNEEAAV